MPLIFLIWSCELQIFRCEYTQWSNHTKQGSKGTEGGRWGTGEGTAGSKWYEVGNGKNGKRSPTGQYQGETDNK